MTNEIRLFLQKAGYDTESMLERGIYSNFRMENGNVLYDVCSGDITGYTEEVRPDGSSRHCGFGQGCFWSDWEDK